MIFFVKRAIKDMNGNRFINAVTIVTIALSIFIVSAFGLFFHNVNNLMDTWKKGVRILAYVKKHTKESQITELKDKIQATQGVASLTFISKEESLNQMKDHMKRQAAIFKKLKENPLPDVFEIQMVGIQQGMDDIEILATRIESLPHVSSVEYGQKWLGRFMTMFNLIKFSGFALCGTFLMASVFIVANTIRLLFYSKQEEIEIMRLVGASDNFIKAPFYVEGIIQGVLGGVIGVTALLITYLLISSNMEQGILVDFLSIRFLPIKICLGIILCGIVAGWLGCYLSLKQILKY